MTARVGFIGVGFMGHGMAKNLIEKGHPLTILGHRNRAPAEDLVKRGAKEAKTAEDLTRNSDVIFICVNGSPIVESLVRGSTGIKAAARKGLLVVDCSTSDPASTIQLAAELEPLGVTFCDAPLSGTPSMAEDGKLRAMIGCDQQTWPKIEPIIRTWAERPEHIGPTGDGHKMKLMINFLAMGYAAIYSEMLAVGKKAGLSPQTIDRGLRGGRMDCGFYQSFFSYVLDRDPEANKFTIANAHKDVRYLGAMAENAGVANPLGSAIRNYYAMAEAAGRGEDFVPTLSDYVASLAGVSLTAE
jgi:3-hydroxyisobutyrate dehydrogenase-like beta-hydroxyacid dehydrogenase